MHTYAYTYALALHVHVHVHVHVHTRAHACACACPCCESGKVITGAALQDAWRLPGLLGGLGCAPERVETHPAPLDLEKQRGLMRRHLSSRADATFRAARAPAGAEALGCMLPRGTSTMRAPGSDRSCARWPGEVGDSHWCMGLQPLVHGVAACGAWGCSLWCMGLQPVVHGVAAA